MSTIVEELHQAIKDGNKTKVVEIVNKDKTCVNLRDSSGWGASLHWAIYYRQADLIVDLLVSGVDFSQKSGWAWTEQWHEKTPLELAKIHDQSIAKVLERVIKYNEISSLSAEKQLEALDDLLNNTPTLRHKPASSFLLLHKMTLYSKLRDHRNFMKVSEEFQVKLEATQSMISPSSTVVSLYNQAASLMTDLVTDPVYEETLKLADKKDIIERALLFCQRVVPIPILKVKLLIKKLELYLVTGNYQLIAMLCDEIESFLKDHPSPFLGDYYYEVANLLLPLAIRDESDKEKYQIKTLAFFRSAEELGRMGRLTVDAGQITFGLGKFFDSVFEEKGEKEFYEKALEYYQETIKKSPNLKPTIDPILSNLNNKWNLLLKVKEREKQEQLLREKQEKKNMHETQQKQETHEVPEYMSKELTEELTVHYICAALSKHIYPENKGTTPKFVSPDIECTEQPIDSIEDWNKQNNFKAGYLAAAYQVKFRAANGSKKTIIVIAHCGTVKTENGDWASNFLLGFGIMHYQFSLANTFCKRVKEKSGDIPIYHAGHSLGAVLAEVMAYEHDHSAVTLESPGSAPIISRLSKVRNNVKNMVQEERKMGEHNPQDLDYLHSRIVSYLSLPNLINTFRDHVGQVYRLEFRAVKTTDWRKIKELNDFINLKIEDFLKNKSGILAFPGISFLVDTFGATIARMRVEEEIRKKLPEGAHPLIPYAFPLVKIFLRDIELHSKDNIVAEFERCMTRHQPLTRKKVIEWPIGPVQYFSLASLMLETNQYEPNELMKDHTCRYLFDMKSVRYRIEELQTNVSEKEQSTSTYQTVEVLPQYRSKANSASQTAVLKNGKGSKEKLTSKL